MKLLKEADISCNVYSSFRKPLRTQENQNKRKWAKHIHRNHSRLMNQQNPFIASLEAASTTCKLVEDDRRIHILAIETSRWKKIFDSKTEYITTVIETQGGEEYEEFIHKIKQGVFGPENIPSLEAQREARLPKYLYLAQQTEHWQEIISEFPVEHISRLTNAQVKKWYLSLQQAAKHLKCMISNLQRIRQDDYNNEKKHSIRIGKHGAIARMTNPKPRSGPVAGSFYPTKPGEPIRRAVNDNERKEASLLAHTMWMDDPPGKQNCHFFRNDP